SSDMFGELFLNLVAYAGKDFRINRYLSLKMLQNVVTRADLEEKNLRERGVRFQPERHQRHEEAILLAGLRHGHLKACSLAALTLAIKYGQPGAVRIHALKRIERGFDNRKGTGARAKQSCRKGNDGFVGLKASTRGSVRCKLLDLDDPADLLQNLKIGVIPVI